ncbi:MAG TPA: ATP-binding protein, partial [Candidatus Polarisedimenticolia bacterium]|nr:ATP-binding protein [Candidatus Polarisedimenticolia bacterium]
MRRVSCRSEPTYRRRLFFATALFIGLFVADLYLIADLAFRDLSHRVIDQAFDASLQALEVPPPAPLGSPLDLVPPRPGPVENCPPSDPQSPATIVPCPSTRPAAPLTPQVFRSMTYRWQRVVTDTQGRILWRGAGQASRVQASGSLQPPLLPQHGEVQEEWEFGNRLQPVIALRQPSPAGSSDIREVGIPRELIDQELQQLQRDLQTKLWIGAAVAVLILLVAFLYVLRLLTRTRLLEAQAQMDDRLKYVGGLAAGLAHEIRNPLNVLSMNLQMLEEEITAHPGVDGGDARLYLSAIQAEIRRLGNLVNNFLSYARPNQPRFESRDLNGILQEVCQLVRPEFDTRRLSLRQDFSAYLPPVDLDENQIRQAIMNILINATQVLKPGGSVIVESRVGSQGEAIIAIEDDGPGIKPEDRERIFEVFFSTRGGGTGLGLPIAARILEAHGGS